MSDEQTNQSVEQPQEQVKRRPGNPNWVKKDKSTDVAAKAAVLIEKDIAQIRVSDEDAWLNLYSAILSTYNVGGQAVAIAAAKTADFALDEFRKRYSK